jgi:GDP-4-dehydro-6-deoxy-D-mannose reductase
MHRYLITGFSGFVSRYFLELLAGNGDAVEVLGVDLNPPREMLSSSGMKVSFQKLDLGDPGATRALLEAFKPSRILHLAAASSVAYSWENPVQAFLNNTNIYLNLIDSLRKLKIPCRVLSVGSSEVYGDVTNRDLPLMEERKLNPVSPYAAARVAQEHLSRVYVNGYGLDIVMTRSFNHIGPRQTDRFVVPSFAKQLVGIAKSGQPGRLTTGDLSIVRDFLDVRDVVRAYHLLFEKGKAGEVYNVSGGVGISLKEVVARMCDLLGVDPEVTTDPHLVRPSDNHIIIGDASRIHRDTGWKPEVSFEKCLEDLVNYWKHVSA